MKTAVFLSGGVDSSVAAALLQDQGHDLIGVMHYHWPESRCCSTAGCQSAEAVAQFLGIPFKSIDVIPEFTKAVVQPYIDSYLNGETPNPCTNCNPKIRFGLTVDKLLTEVPDVVKIATGHYARIQKQGDRYILMKGVDPEKDQAYMLYALTQEQLARTIFPVGELSKIQVREIAERKGLPSAKLPDSQDVCYAVNGHARFVEDFTGGRGLARGKLKDESGKEIGKHEGIHRYTVGQRRGLKTALGYPAYVKSIDAQSQTVVLAPKQALFQSSMAVRDLTWSAFDRLEGSLNCQIKIRYGSPAAPGRLSVEDTGNLRVDFTEPQFAITPGQRAVFYDADVVLGGGIIQGII